MEEYLMSTTIALAGNPNSGKTTLFNALTGSNQFVGNWPGVTVEKKSGKLKSDKEIEIMDLPGIYSLSPYTLEEVVARNYIIDEHPDAILNIIDGTNLERNLYLTTQLTEIGIPVVVAVNMMDLVEKKGDKINIENLSKELGCKVVEISALKGDGVEEAVRLAIQSSKRGSTEPQHTFSGKVEHALAHIEEAVLHELPDEQQRWFAIKLFERDAKIIEKLNIQQQKIDHIQADIHKCENEFDDDAESIITTERYKYIDSIIHDCVKRKNHGGLTTSDKIDKIVTNRFLAIPIFAVVMFLIYYISVTTVGSIVTDWANDGLFGEGWHLFGIGPEIPGIPTVLAGWLEAINCAEWLQALILDGIIAGVGAVIGFVPQMLVLFIMLAFLESCGYMARIAFILDRLFRRFGLSGKSFIPFLIGTGCGVPGIMASRTIENEKDRRMTVMTTTFMVCSAKLPIVALIAGAIFNNAGWVATTAYFIGIAAIVVSGIILKKTKLFRGDVSPFVMELPTYHMPTFINVMRSMWERGWSFIKKAGTIIVLSSMFIWFTSSYGWSDGSFGSVDMEDSMLAAIGQGIDWLFSPLGWGDWKSAVAAITGLIAKENVVATFGILYGFAEVTEDGEEIWSNLAAAYSGLTAFSFLVFNLLCAPCFAAMGAIRREMNSAKWFWFAVGYQCVFAYMIALCIFQFGSLFSGAGFGIGTVFAIIVFVLLIFMLFRPMPKDKLEDVTSVNAA